MCDCFAIAVGRKLTKIIAKREREKNKARSETKFWGVKEKQSDPR